MAEFLTEEETSKLIEHGMEEDINYFERKIKRRIAYRQQNWTTNPTKPEDPKDSSIPRHNNPINIILVGLGGAGKSSLGNTLTGEEKFKTGKSASAVTETCTQVNFKAYGQDFSVVDTPGYLLGKLDNPSVLTNRTLQVLKGFKLIGHEVHAIVFVINSSNSRERAHEIEVMYQSRLLSKTSNTIKYSFIVATHAASNYATDTVDNFILKSSTAPEFQELITLINNRVILVEQEAQDMKEADIDYSEKERVATRDMVLAMVKRVIEDNDGIKLEYDTIKKEYEQWFPPEALVNTPGGIRAMEHLELNDEVLVVNDHGQVDFEKVIMFSHAAGDEMGCFISINTDDEKVLNLSPGHLVHVGEVGQLKTAKDVKVGDVMFACDEVEYGARNLKQVKVTEISKEWFTPGIYCPHTPGGSIIVDGVLASCYTDLMSPTLAHTLMYPVRMLHRVLPEDWFVWLMPYNSEQGMPKVLWKLRNMIPSLQK